jgi:hypothetical protein
MKGYRIAKLMFETLVFCFFLFWGCANEKTETFGGEEEACGEIVFSSIGWEEANTAGLRASEIFSPIQGSCTGKLVWDTTSMGGLGRGIPESGESNISVELTFDTGTAEAGYWDKKDTLPECTETFFKAQAQVDVATEDGVFDDEGVVNVGFDSERNEHNFDRIRIIVPPQETGGTFTVEINEDETRTSQYQSLQYQIDEISETCSGGVYTEIMSHYDNGTASLSCDEIGHWTSLEASDAGVE